jgi:predicted permease
MTSFLRRLTNRWRRPALDDEFDEEIRFHVDLRVESNLRRGLSPDEARAEARRHFGSALRAKEGMREARINGVLDSLVRDLHHGARMFLRQPGLTALAVVTLSLGIGANAAMFSLLNAVLLRPLPLPDADRLVAIQDGYRTVGAQVSSSSTIPELLDVRERSKTLAQVSFWDTRDFQIEGGSEPARVLGARVEPTLLSMLGMPPQLGRVFARDEGRDGAPPVIVLSDGFWRRNFGADPGAIGKRLRLNGQSATIVGVMPAAFPLDLMAPEAIDVFVPYPMIPVYTSWDAPFAGVRRVSGLARLGPAVTPEAADAELSTLSTTIAAQHPVTYRRESDQQSVGFFMSTSPLRDRVVGGSRPPLLMLFGAVGLVLLLSCMNAAQFLLARSVERGGELAIRSALGASRRRLMAQLLAEALLLAVTAAAAGVFQTFWLTRLVRTLLPERAPVVGAVGIDVDVLAFTAALALVTAAVCGVVPAFKVSRVHPARSLDACRAIGSSGRTRHLLIAAEVAISIVLLAGAGLLLRTVADLQRTVTGYDTDDVIVMQMRGIGAGPALGERYRDYLERVRTVANVEAATIASGPLPSAPGMSFTLPGQRADAAAVAQQGISYLIVSPGYFDVLRIPILAGRDLTDADAQSRPPVAVVNQALAQQHFNGVDPVGRQITIGPGPRAATLTIVGVVGNVKPILQQGDVAQIYVSYLQQPEPSIALMVRSRAGAAVSDVAIKRAIWSVVPQQAVFSVRSLADLVSTTVRYQRTIAVLLTTFATLALVMSITGIYTVVTYHASRRSKEVALRRAIGATGYAVVLVVTGQTCRWAIAGLIVGIGGAVGASRILRSVVERVSPLDASLLAQVAIIYLVVVVMAMSAPALRALRLDPATILRAD